MIEKVEEIGAKVKAAVAGSAEEVEKFRLQFLSRNGEIPALFKEFRNVPNDQKRAFGAAINALKEAAESRYEELKAGSSESSEGENSGLDLTLPAMSGELGSRHPISIVRNEIIDIFSRIGFDVSEGPEIEDDWHNFSALNFPANHPARDMQDTFFVDGGDEEFVLRTHTSSVQMRVMETSKPPIRTLSPGRVYRNEAISARSHCFFHQIEGLYIDKDVSFADLKQTLLHFAREMFGKKSQIRLRPSYFPFTEPSAEMDVSCVICQGKGCNVCKNTGWLEILGCGMVDPAVLKNAGIDPEVYSGFAFGMGVERIAMLRYGVKDLRYFSENDVRFLNQFTSA